MGYGLWNDVKKEFQFGIDKETYKEAEKEAVEKLGKGMYKYRFEIKLIGKNSKKQPSYKNVTDEEIANYCDRNGLSLTKKIGYYRIEGGSDIRDGDRFEYMHSKKIISYLRFKNRVVCCKTIVEKKLRSIWKAKGYEHINVIFNNQNSTVKVLMKGNIELGEYKLDEKGFLIIQ